MISESLLDEYRLLADQRAFVVLPSRTLLQFSGTDCRKFLHGFCTADVNTMRSGNVKEVFVLNARGRTLAFGHLIALRETLWLTAASATVGSLLCEHFERYIIREKVQVNDVSADFESVFVSGPGVQITSELAIDLNPDTATSVEFDGDSLIAARAEFAGEGFLLLVNTRNRQSLCESLTTQGLTPCSIAALEMQRVESGTPWYGIEIDDTNLPQEIRRDNTAISFTKGCYLGQETVARIDAIGHVNRFLVGLKQDGIQRPTIGQAVFAGPEKVGEIKSSTFSPKLDSWLALAYVRSQNADVGTEISIDGQKSTVLMLPLS